MTRDGVVCDSVTCDCVTYDGVTCDCVTYLVMESSEEKWAEDLLELGTWDIFLDISHSGVCMCWKL